MRRETITLVTAMALSTVLMAACDKPGTPDSSKSAPSSTTPPPSATPTPAPIPAPAPTDQKK